MSNKEEIIKILDEAKELLSETTSELPPKCDCCDRYVMETSIMTMISSEAHLCHDCAITWYDGGGTNPKVLQKNVLEKYGQWGGCAAEVRDILLARRKALNEILGD